MNQENKGVKSNEVCKLCLHLASVLKNGFTTNYIPPTDSNWNWEGEFREYFDKTLKPKKPTMANLDRELCIDFIRKLLAEREAESREKMIKEIERKKTNLNNVNLKTNEGELVRIVGNTIFNEVLEIIKNKEE